MANKGSLNSAIVMMIFLASFCWARGPGQTDGQKDKNMMDKRGIENFLRKARIASVLKGRTGGRTAPYIVILKDGEKTMRAVFKYIHRPRPNLLSDSYKREIAAYELSKLLDLDIVPPAVEREVDGRKGSLQFFLEDCITDRDRRLNKLEPPDPASFQSRIEEIKVFENLVANGCLDETHLFIHKSNWKICRIDFSQAFDPSPELIPGCELTRSSRKLFRNLQNLDEGPLRSALGPYLLEDEIQNLLIRKMIVIDKIKELIAAKGVEAVLFD